MKILISTGGTAGHLYPAISLAEELAEDEDNEILFVGSEGGLETELIPAEGYELRTLRVKGFPRGISKEAVFAGWQMLTATAAARKIIVEFRPEVVVGMGGFASVPASLQAWLRRIPIVIHEQNLVPGRANAMLARLSKVIAVSFSESERFFPKEKVAFVGNPIRKKIRRIERREAADPLGIDAEKPTVLIFGGSRGAKKINEAVEEVISKELNDFQIVHLTGEKGFAGFAGYASSLYHPFAYLNEMQFALSSCDLVVSRAGASTIFEIAAVGVPAILVPYPFATDDHQLKNAKSLEIKGAAEIILDSEINGKKLIENIDAILYNEEKLKSMAGSMKEIGEPDAAKKLRVLVKETARKGIEPIER